MGQIVRKIYLHWSATSYTWARPGSYHTIVLGNGTVRRFTGYDQPISKHTYARNADSVAICLACMGGSGWRSYPPTEAQIESMCQEVANLAIRLGWQPKDITVKRVLTHAEAAANRDYSLEAARKVSGWPLPTSTPQTEQYLALARQLGLPHENYGPSHWFDGWPGGFVERWDLWQLKPSDRPGQGGFTLRQKIQQYMAEGRSPTAGFNTTPNNRLRSCPVYVGTQLIGQGMLLPDQRCYVKFSDLARAYQLELVWNNPFRFVNVKTDRYQVKYIADVPLFRGYPAVDIYLNRPMDEDGQPINDPEFPARPFMQGLVIEGATYVMIADFCNEFGISLRVDPNFSVYLEGPSATPQPPTGEQLPSPNISQPELPKKLRDCDIFSGDRLISRGALMPDQRCYVKIADLAAAYNLGLRWNSAYKYVNVLSDRFRAKTLPNSPIVPGYAAVDLYFNREEDSRGNPIDSANPNPQPFLRGIVIDNVLYVLVADFCNELGISIRVDPDFSVHLGAA